MVVADSVFDGSKMRRGRIAVGIVGGRIEFIEPVAALGAVGVGAERIECPAGSVLLPGLVDLNMKLVRWRRAISRGWADEPVVDTVLRCQANLAELLAQGCTHVRDLAASSQLSLQLRDAVAAGRMSGPSISAAGMPIAAAGRASRSYPVRPSRGADEARGHARELLAEGVDVISVAVTSGAATDGWQQLTEAEVAAVADEAHRAGKRVAAVCVGAQGARAAVAAGVDSVEHGVSIDDETLELMAKRGTALVPTLRILERFGSRPADYGVPEGAIAKMPGLYGTALDTVSRAARAGVAIAAGTDRHLGESVQDEVEELMGAGLSSEEALRACTGAAGRVLGAAGKIGAVEAGARADLLLVPGDPTLSPEVLRAPIWVMASGQIVYRRDGGR